MTYKLLPRPRDLLSVADSFDLLPVTDFRISANAAKLAEIVICEFAAETGRELTTDQGKAAGWHFSLGKPPEVADALHDNPEAYRLEITATGIGAMANTYNGLLYAWQTLKQLLRHDSESLPCLSIHDWPDLRWRIYHLDMKATRRRLDNLHAILPQLAEFKINAVLIEYEDYIEFERHPELAVEGALTQEDIREWVDAAAAYGISVIPLVQTLAHWQYILNRPEYRHLQEKTGDTTTACPSQPETWTLVADFLDEILALHADAPFVHVGLDEAFHVGVCDLCKAALDGRPPSSLFIDWSRRVCDYVLAGGITPMLWSDMIETMDASMGEQLHRGAYYIDWQYMNPQRDFQYLEVHHKNHISREWLKRPNGEIEGKLPVYFRPNFTFYENLPADERERYERLVDNPEYPKRFRADARLAWLKELGLKRGGVSGIRVSCHGRMAPRFVHGQMNTRFWAEACREHGADVLIGSSWARGHSFASINAHPELDWYGIATLGDAGWAPLDASEMRDFDERFGFQFFGLPDGGIGDLYYLFEQSDERAGDTMNDFYTYIAEACEALLPQVCRNRDRFELFAEINEVQRLRTRAQFAVLEVEYFYQTWDRVPPAFKRRMLDDFEAIGEAMDECCERAAARYAMTLRQADADELAATQLLFWKDNMEQMKAQLQERLSETAY